MLHLGFSRDFTRKITTSVERLYPKSAVLRTDDVIGCCNVTTYMVCNHVDVIGYYACTNAHTHTHTHTCYMIKYPKWTLSSIIHVNAHFNSYMSHTKYNMITYTQTHTHTDTHTLTHIHAVQSCILNAQNIHISDISAANPHTFTPYDWSIYISHQAASEACSLCTKTTHLTFFCCSTNDILL